MNDFTLTAYVDQPFAAVLARVQSLLGDAGFGVLTQIDLQATMRTKLDIEVPAQVILGACRPQLAHRALQADPRVAALLPCNVVVADVGDQRTRVEVLDPAVLASFSAADDVAEVAEDARGRLTRMIAALTGEEVDSDAA